MAGCCGHGVWHNPPFFFAFLHFANAKNHTPSTLHLIKSINHLLIIIYIYRLSSHPYIFCMQKCKNTK